MDETKNSKELLEAAILDDKVNTTDARLVEDFLIHYGTLKNLTEGSKNKYYYCLKAFLEETHKRKKALSELQEKDVLQLIQWLQKSNWSEHTREDYWQRFSLFYKWASKRGTGYDETGRNLICGEDKYVYKIDKNNVERKGTLSPEEILQIVHTEPNLNFKAFFSVLFESGMRAGEAFSLRVRDVEKENGGYTIHVRMSKTEKRPIPLINFSVSYLSKWLKAHPGNSDSPLFLNNVGGAMRYESAGKHLRQLLKLTKIDRRKVSLHSFRHSRATELAGTGMSEFEMCKLFGWKIGSAMPRTYIREQNIDVRRSLRRAYGLEQEEEHKVLGRTCLQCEHLNPVDAEFCDNCNLPLDGEALKKIKTNAEASKMEDLLKKLLREAKPDLIAQVKSELQNE